MCIRDRTSVDLIYGTPGESLADWRRSVEAAIAMTPDHVSAYALVVEEGTPLARRVARGEMDAPDDDDAADKYELADELLAAAGFAWYEVSNWAATPAGVCRHNLGSVSYTHLDVYKRQDGAADDDRPKIPQLTPSTATEEILSLIHI